jgi:glycogen debranching enzyme
MDFVSLNRRRNPAIYLLLLFLVAVPSVAEEKSTPLKLTRTARTWEFLSAVSTRAGLFGNEAGNFEAWVYPLKIFRNFNLRFHTEGRVIPAEALVRRVTVRPESCTIYYAGDTFSVAETLLIPINEPGAYIKIDAETEQPLDVEAVFQRDFQLEWPAALGGTYLNWDKTLHAFYFGEEQKKFAALVGSQTAAEIQQEYATNYSESHENSIDLGVISKGKDTRVIVITASMNGRAEAESTYNRLGTSFASKEQQASDYYKSYLQRTVRLELPDSQLQQAYDWARISVLQGLATNPFLGTGLIAGYRTSGESQRPGFAWFFGRDSLWTSFALDAEGDFASTRTALEFISKYQRADGKIPHEISQGASFVDWFKAYPYPYASADASPLYIIAMDEYVAESGDADFARQKWESLWNAYHFLRSTYDSEGLPQNFGFGHGWVEGGPLLPVKSELYQAGLGAEALQALSNLAHLLGKEDVSKQLAAEFSKHKTMVNQLFWSDATDRFVFALDQSNKQINEPSVLATVPMWFHLLDNDKAAATITQLATHDHETDWGMRIISSTSSKYSAGGYHFGSVWPLFTGWASVGEYSYHRALPAYANLRANVLMALDGSLGHVTEVLSGDYYQPLATSSPHQIWSAAMVISPLLRGLFGLEVDAVGHRLTFAPHVPADWGFFAIDNVRVGTVALNFRYHKTTEEITLETSRSGTGDCAIEFSPALSPRAQVAGAELNGRPVPFHLEKNAADQHVTIRFAAYGGPNVLRIRLKNDFGLSFNSTLPALGARSRGLRVVSESWNPSRDALTLDVSGTAGGEYEVNVWNAQQIVSVDGAELVKASGGEKKLRIHFGQNAGQRYPHEKIVIHFSESGTSTGAKQE